MVIDSPAATSAAAVTRFRNDMRQIARPRRRVRA